MPVFTKNGRNILYIHVPKTGGSTIESLFARSGYDISFLRTAHSPIFKVIRSSPQHYHAEILRAIFHLEKFDYVFMTVRNPISRLLSEYKMRNPSQQIPVDVWIAGALEAYNKNPFVYDNHIRPQSEFLVPSAEVWKQEDRYDDVWLAQMSDRVGETLNRRVIDALVAKEASSLSISPDTMSKVRQFYRDDFDIFNY